MLIQAAPNCPCCGHAISAMAELRWNGETRILSGNGLVITISPLRAKIFGLLWNNFKSGRLVEKSKIMHELYSDDPDGGPESDNIVSVQILHLKNQIKPFGLTVKGRCGYALAMRVPVLAGTAGE